MEMFQCDVNQIPELQLTETGPCGSLLLNYAWNHSVISIKVTSNSVRKQLTNKYFKSSKFTVIG